MKTKLKEAVFIILSILLLLVQTDATSFPTVEKENYKFDVEIRPGIFLDTAVQAFVNPESPNGKNIICLHGFTHTGSTYHKWFKSLILDNNSNQDISRVFIVNLPGRGKTGVPANRDLLFGDIDLDDYALFFEKTLDYFKTRQISCDVLVAHSMGSMIVQLLQNRFITQQTNLSIEYDNNHVLFLAPVLPRELPWDFADSGTPHALIAPFIETSDQLGAYINIPPTNWRDLFFTDSQGSLAPGTPTEEEITSYGYSSIESLSASMQLLGNPDESVPRPSISADIFNNTGSTLRIVSFCEDSILFNYPGDHQALYSHLTGDITMANLYTVSGEKSVHDNYLLGSTQLDDILLSIAAE
ncbi:MAG: alpha/beta hydrolase [bacterium]|nr:alpha/beta hydrolase [bacterium]